MQQHQLHIKIVWLLILLIPALSACVSVANVPTPTPSATIPPSTPTVFFPTLIPTATQTPLPSRTPTPDIVAGLDRVIYQDRFNDPTDWQTVETDAAGVSYLDGHLILAVNEAGTFFSAHSPAPVFSDGYLEVQARALLCSEGDKYGLIFRVAPDGDHYRYTLSCSGMIRVSRISGGEELVLIPDTPTNTVLSGLLVDNRLSVLMSGDNFRFFLNGIEVISKADDTLPSGKAGLIIRAGAGGQTTVSFDNFRVRALKPSRTPTPTSRP